jgi:hypothetical protein
MFFVSVWSLDMTPSRQAIQLHFTPVNSLVHGLPRSLGMPIQRNTFGQIHILLPMAHKGMTKHWTLVNMQPMVI